MLNDEEKSSYYKVISIDEEELTIQEEKYENIRRIKQSKKLFKLQIQFKKNKTLQLKEK